MKYFENISTARSSSLNSFEIYPWNTKSLSTDFSIHKWVNESRGMFANLIGGGVTWNRNLHLNDEDCSSGSSPKMWQEYYFGEPRTKGLLHVTHLDRDWQTHSGYQRKVANCCEFLAMDWQIDFHYLWMLVRVFSLCSQLLVSLCSTESTLSSLFLFLHHWSY